MNLAITPLESNSPNFLSPLHHPARDPILPSALAALLFGMAAAGAHATPP